MSTPPFQLGDVVISKAQSNTNLAVRMTVHYFTDVHGTVINDEPGSYVRCKYFSSKTDVFLSEVFHIDELQKAA